MTSSSTSTTTTHDDPHHPTTALLSCISWQSQGPRVGDKLENRSTGSLYAVVAYAPSQPSLRLPELWRVTTTTTECNHTAAPDEPTTTIWLEEDFGHLVEQHDTAAATSTLATTHYERIQERLEYEVETSILPKLLLVAVVEEALHEKIQMQHTAKTRQSSATVSSTKSPTKLFYEQPKYYKHSPSHYMEAPTLPQQTAGSSINTEESPSIASTSRGCTPSALAHRLRAATKLAYDHFLSQQYVLQYQQQQLSSTVRRSSRLPPPPPPTPPQVWQKGGRTAIFLLEEEQGSCRSEEEKDELLEQTTSAVTQSKKKKKKTKKKKPETHTTAASEEPLPDKRERKQIQHHDNQEALEEVLQCDSEDSDNDKSEGDEEEEFEVDEEEEDETDEELQVDTRVAEVHEDDESSSSSEEEESSEEESDAETVEDESELIRDNPYLEPTQDDILEYLGRRGKAWSAADLQHSMIFCLEHKISFEPSLAIDHLALGTRNQKQREESIRIVLECTSGEKLRELKKLDPAEFARRRFVWKIASDDEDEKKSSKLKEDKKALRLQRQAEQQEAELQYKEERAWALWRYKGINLGHAVWPQWEEAWRARQEPRNVRVTPEPTSTVAENVSEAEPVETEETDQALAEALESSGRRRTRRAGVSAAEGGSVYYGQQSTMTSKQLMDAILRLVTPGNFQTLWSLQTLVQEESTNPLYRARVAVGRLLWKRNQLTKCNISALWTDSRLWNVLKNGSLLKPATEPEAVSDIPGDRADEPPAGVNMGENGSMIVPAHENTGTNDSKQLEVLTAYIRGLHETELQLRGMILELVTYTPISVVATAADERLGSMEASDAADFQDNVDSLPWSTMGHKLLGKMLFRPPPGEETQEGAECQWYKVHDFVQAVELQLEDDEMTAEIAVPEPRNVERRARFRVFPHKNEGEVVEGDSKTPIVLTEAQVHAGIIAADMQRKESVPILKNVHPFNGTTCQNVTLHGVGSSSALLGKIVGHDTVVMSDASDGRKLDHRVLILPDASSDAEEADAFWASVRSEDDSTIICQRMNDGTLYTVSQSDFHSSSPAFQACRKVVEFLRHQPQSNVFAEPVDPVALNIPTYFSVVKKPMDVSTLSSHLESGKYSQVPPTQNPGRHPVSRMLNGPFKDDVMQVFDNAMLFNPPDDWIHLAAAATKKNVTKKIDQMSKEADQGLIGSHYLRTVRKSVYVDPDSDVDMDEDESDRNDEDYDARNGRQKRKRKRPGGSREEFSTRALEAPIRLQHVLSESQGLRGPFADLNVRSNASEFSMTDEWNCRHKVPVVEAEPEEDMEEKREREELAELLALQLEAEEMEQAGLRRSSRAHTVEQTSDFDHGQSNQPTSDLEYFLREEICPPLDEYHANAERTASDRTEVEAHREAMHEEYFAVLHQRLFKRLQTDEMVPYGMLANNLFPPYLGRVIPMPGHETSSADVTWEIRVPYVIPAIRWVLRGLVNSGHLAEVEPGVVIANNVYLLKEDEQPFDVLDMREMQRRKRATAVEQAESSEEEVEMSEYEKLRAERVARNADRLKALGLT